MSMFTLCFYSHYYKFFKAGMLFDFFIKKFVFLLLKLNFIVANAFFSEKYVVEHLFLKSFSSTKNIWRFLSQYNNEFTYSVISVLLFMVLALIVFI